MLNYLVTTWFKTCYGRNESVFSPTMLMSVGRADYIGLANLKGRTVLACKST